jgi:hypothetical protein
MPASSPSPAAPPPSTSDLAPSRSVAAFRPKAFSNRSRVAPPRKRCRAPSGTAASAASSSESFRRFSRVKAARLPSREATAKPMRSWLPSCRKAKSERWGKPNSASPIAESAVDLPASFAPSTTCRPACSGKHRHASVRCP